MASFKMVKEETYYDLLGVKSSCTIDELGKSFMKLALKSYGEELKYITQACRILSNPEKRRIYDQSLLDNENGMTPPMDEMFYEGGARKHVYKAANIIHECDVTLEELYNGAIRVIAVERYVFCQKCKGTGKARDICLQCNGSGIKTNGSLVYGNLEYSVCSACQGHGIRWKPTDKCDSCHGFNVVLVWKHICLHIDKGMEHGSQIIFGGQGNQQFGFENGDIIIVLNEREHEVFKRSGNDLIIRMERTLTEALSYFEKSIKTLDNRSLVISCIPGEAINQLSSIFILNEGMPEYNNPLVKGNLIIQFYP